MSDYLTTETVTYEYDTSGRVNKVTTITTEGPDDRALQAFHDPNSESGGSFEAMWPKKVLRDAPMSSVSTDPFTKAKVNQWFGEHEERDMVVDLDAFREAQSRKNTQGV